MAAKHNYEYFKEETDIIMWSFNMHTKLFLELSCQSSYASKKCKLALTINKLRGQSRIRQQSMVMDPEQPGPKIECNANYR
jgi:hypothetical protein